MGKGKAFELLKQAWSVILKVMQKILFVFAIILIVYPISELILWILANVFPFIWSDTFHFGWIDNFVNHWLPYIYHPKCNWFCFMMFNVVCLSISGFCAEYNSFSLCGIFGIILVYFNFNSHLFETWIGWITALGVIICLGLGAGNSSGKSSSNSSYTNTSSSYVGNSNSSCIHPTKYISDSPAEKVIGSAVQRGSMVYVFDEKGSQMFARDGILAGYTSKSVSIRRGKIVYVFDNIGRQIASHST